MGFQKTLSPSKVQQEFVETIGNITPVKLSYWTWMWRELASRWYPRYDDDVDARDDNLPNNTEIYTEVLDMNK